MIIEGLTPEIEEQIANKANELKAANPKDRIFPIAVEGDVDYGEKPVYVGYFKQPSFPIFSKYLAASQKDQAIAMRSLARDCFLDGDKELIDNDSLFLFGLMGQLSEIIKIRQGKLVNLSKAGK
ncbi:MAG: hypothetical protein K5920_09595 [Bacteroidales bacterium]|nr:hypothetical protein [Bacteroidales bacterium]